MEVVSLSFAVSSAPFSAGGVGALLRFGISRGLFDPSRLVDGVSTLTGDNDLFSTAPACLSGVPERGVSLIDSLSGVADRVRKEASDL